MSASKTATPTTRLTRDITTHAFTPDPTLSRVVRVFISSTFRDFGEERDLLMQRVFTELRRKARDRFVEVIGVDVRWGITEEESQQGETLPICLGAIEHSRPYFSGLLGERYGSAPSAKQYLALAEREESHMTVVVLRGSRA